MGACKKCGDPIGKGEYFKHMWEKHPEDGKGNQKKAQSKAAAVKLADNKPTKPSKKGLTQTPPLP